MVPRSAPNCKAIDTVTAASRAIASIGEPGLLCAGSYPDGRIAEIFLSSHKPGSPIEPIARDAAVTVSIALQCGADLETIRAALTRGHDGGAASPLGAALDALAEAAQ